MTLEHDTRIVYLNGEFTTANEARVSPFDRGYLFADGVYEVTSVIDGKMVDNNAHMTRLQRSLAELEMALPCPVSEIVAIQMQLIEMNNLSEGALYLQVTRGVADRDFGYPADATPSLFLFTQPKNLLNNPLASRGIKVITVDDIRWKRRDIKTIGLLAPSMAKQAAAKQGADDAWLIEDGFITEGSSNNAYIIDANNTIITRQLSNAILHGITRAAVLKLAADNKMTIEERQFTLEEAYQAKEAFITSATTFALPVVQINGKPIGDGKVGETATKLRKLYIDLAKASITG